MCWVLASWGGSRRLGCASGRVAEAADALASPRSSERRRRDRGFQKGPGECVQRPGGQCVECGPRAARSRRGARAGGRRAALRGGRLPLPLTLHGRGTLRWRRRQRSGRLRGPRPDGGRARGGSSRGRGDRLCCPRWLAGPLDGGRSGGGRYCTGRTGEGGGAGDGRCGAASCREVVGVRTGAAWPRDSNGGAAAVVPELVGVVGAGGSGPGAGAGALTRERSGVAGPPGPTTDTTRAAAWPRIGCTTIVERVRRRARTPR